jgi:hypothetical protein
MTGHCRALAPLLSFHRRLAALAGAFAFAFALPAAADNLLLNGGFELGDFTDWVGLDNFEFSDVLCPGAVPADPTEQAPAEGDCYARFGPEGSVGTLAQGINTTPGQTYAIDFAFASDGGLPNSASASFGSTLLASGTDIPSTSGYVTRHFTAVATGTNTTLSFSFRDDEGYLLLDAVSVTAVPEPTTVALIGLALSALALSRRRTR